MNMRDHSTLHSTTTCINKQPCYFFLFMYIIDISNIPTIHDENISILEYTYINITIENLVNLVTITKQHHIHAVKFRILKN
jgi:hypothetical protein